MLRCGTRPYARADRDGWWEKEREREREREIKYWGSDRKSVKGNSESISRTNLKKQKYIRKGEERDRERQRESSARFDDDDDDDVENRNSFPV